MTRFVLLIGDDGYEKYIAAAAEGNSEVIIRKYFKSKLINKIFKIHNSWPLNKKWELPLKFIWFNGVLSKDCLERNSNIVFLFYESFHLSYSKQYLKYLKKIFRNSKFCFILHNPIGEYNLNKINVFRDRYDCIITFNSKDELDYGFIRPKYFPIKFPYKQESQIKKSSDVFFIGSEKGRLDILIAIYEKLISNGLKCEFYIVGVKEERKRYSESIVYNTTLTYEEVLQKIQSTNCVLEVLQNGQMYSSIRECEAFQYRKKLLTTNSDILNEPFYNPKVIQVITDPEKIDTEFVRLQVDYELFPSDEYWSFRPFMNFIMENI
jgi:glycosyltransferase involved in cell wall biosynthesis